MYCPRHLCRPACISNSSRLPLCYSTPSKSQGVQSRAQASNSTDPVLFKLCFRTSTIHQGPPTSTFHPLQLTVPKRFGASVRVSDTTIQLQRSFVYVLNGSKNFWWHEGDLNNSRQVLLMLWLWILYSCLLYMHVAANVFLCPWQHFSFFLTYMQCKNKTATWSLILRSHESGRIFVRWTFTPGELSIGIHVGYSLNTLIN